MVCELRELRVADGDDAHRERTRGGSGVSAPTAYGVRPLALIATTASAAVTPSVSISRSPAAVSSSAASCSIAEPPAPPAISAVTWPGVAEKVASHSAASSSASRPEVPAPT